MVKYRPCIYLFLYLTLLAKAGEAELIQRHVIQGDYTAFARHPTFTNSIFAANDDEIFIIDTVTGTAIELAKLDEGDADDIELVTGPNSQFLAIASGLNGCIHQMDITTFAITHFIGKCYVVGYKVNTDFQNTVFTTPRQLAYDASSQILYVNENEKLVACNLADDWTTEIVVKHDYLQLPSSSRFYFSVSSPYYILVSDRAKDKIVHLRVATNMSVEEVNLVASSSSITYVASVAGTPYVLRNDWLERTDGQRVCVQVQGSMECQWRVKVMDKLNDSTIVMKSKQHETYVFGSDEIATTTSSTTSTSQPTSIERGQLPSHHGQKRYKFGQLFQNGRCNGDGIETAAKTSMEMCALMCISDLSCTSFSYNQIESSCDLFTACASSIQQQGTDSYMIAV